MHLWCSNPLVQTIWFNVQELVDVATELAYYIIYVACCFIQRSIHIHYHIGNSSILFVGLDEHVELTAPI